MAQTIYAHMNKPTQKISEAKRTGGVAQVPTKCKTLTSNPNTTKENHKLKKPSEYHKTITNCCQCYKGGKQSMMIENNRRSLFWIGWEVRKGSLRM
jgi:hypothetical protein